MVIKGLTQLIKTNSPDAIKTMNLHNLSGKTVAIDASLFMYKMLINMRTSNQAYFKSKEGKIVSHITGIFYKTANYLAVDITPIYVFDGTPGPGCRINISVLDKEYFAPITQKLGWN